MLTRELMRQVIRLTASRELDTAPVETVADIIGVCNEALAEVWLRMPAEMRRLDVTKQIAAPQTVDVSPHVGNRWAGNTFPTLVGCAIQMPDDPVANRLISENALEREHVGNSANDGVPASALVWNDAVLVPPTATMLHEQVYFELNGNHSQLVPWPYTIPAWSQLDSTPNTPQFYAIRGAGFTAPTLEGMRRRNTDIPPLQDPPHGWFLHLYPRPSAAGTLRFSLSLTGEQIGMDDYRRNNRLMLPDRLSATAVSIARQKLLASEMFVGSPEQRATINQEAERARDDLRRLITSHVSVPGRIGTPAGW